MEGRSERRDFTQYILTEIKTIFSKEALRTVFFCHVVNRQVPAMPCHDFLIQTRVKDIEEQVRSIQTRKANLNKENVDREGQSPEKQRVGLGAGGHFDTDIYGSQHSKFEGYHTYIPAEDAEDDDDVNPVETTGPVRAAAPLNALNDSLNDKEYDPLAEHRRQKISDREDEYRARRRQMIISPERHDPFADGGKTPDPQARTYQQILREKELAQQEKGLKDQMREKAKAGDLKVVNGSSAAKPSEKKRRWDQPAGGDEPLKKRASTWDQAETGGTPSHGKWDETPGKTKGSATPGATPGASTRIWDETPRASDTPSHMTPGGHQAGWAETPKTDRGGGDLIEDTPTPATNKRRSRWDETPGAHTPSQMTPGHMTPSMTPGGHTPGGMTPSGMSGMTTPGGGTPSGFTPGGMTPGGFTPSGSTPTGAKAMAMATPTPGHLMSMTPEQLQAFTWQREIDERNRPLSDEDLDAMFPPGYKVLQPPTGYIPIRTPARKLIATPTPMAGTPQGFRMQTPDTKTSVVDMQPKGNLPMMKPDDMQYFDKLLQDVDEEALTPEEQKERRIMKLLLKIKNGTPPMRKAREFGAGPLFNQILPLLMSPTLEDQERHLLVKVIDRILYKLDDLVRPYVHKILVVIEPLLIDEDYYARVEGREIISNLAKAAGLATMISTMRPDIDNMDEYVRNTTARAFAVVASALGIPSLLPFLKAVCKSKKSWQARHTGIKIVQQIAILMGCAILPHLKSLVEIIEHGLVDEQQKVRTITALALAALAEAATPYGIESFDSGLAAFLKAIGYLIPLMDAEYANYYTREVMLILIREFQSPDEEMKKIVLKVVKQCCATDGVEPQYIKDNILPPFFKHFWNQRMALDRRNYRQLVDTTVEIANKVGAAEIIGRVVDDLKDEAEQYRKMVMETIEKVMANLGAADVDSRLEEQLIDGILYAFQEQTTEDVVMLNGFGTVVNALGKRVKPYLPQICGTILWRLNNKSAKEKLMGHLGVVLYEYLGEEYPEVLGSILGALKHEKVQENCIDLVGRIADRGAEFVSAREWMRICFELLELLKAHKKAIRRATVNTFVQERQNRVCTTVAIAIVAETCSPFTVLPALMNEYRVPELNVQNGVLKSLSFMFEDLVHRQTSMSAIQHMALGVYGFGCEDALVHLMNYVWPNVFETSPHVVQAFMGAIEGMRDGMIPAFPRAPNDAKNNFLRYELDYIL
ncbi:SF3B1-like protein [Mya arenaria]|uniref:SF3B1-like protein n=1 Tax=Mya arenaria TaxID=6604 RepID=A0ABY7DBM4_MYAAR|nr:SF3B1-like protein [Mya arenaria]